MSRSESHNKQSVSKLRGFFESLSSNSSGEGASLLVGKPNLAASERDSTLKYVKYAQIERKLDQEESLLNENGSFKSENDSATHNELESKTASQTSVRSQLDLSMPHNSSGIELESLHDSDDHPNESKIKVIYESSEVESVQQEVTNVSNTQQQQVLDKNKKFSNNILRLLKLLLTAKCYCVLMLESPHSKNTDDDLAKLKCVFNEIARLTLTRLIHINHADISVDECHLAEFYNYLCELHGQTIKLTNQFNRMISVGRIKESDINAMFDKIKSIVEIILWIQRVTIDRAPVNNDSNNQNSEYYNRKFLEQRSSEDSSIELSYENEGLTELNRISNLSDITFESQKFFG